MLVSVFNFSHEICGLSSERNNSKRKQIRIEKLGELVKFLV